jgi:large subunit ribosomal protein L1
MARHGKRITQAREGIDRFYEHDLATAVKAVKARATAKFDETIDIAMNLNLDTRKADQNLRGMVQLPHGTGKTIRVAVFAKGDAAVAAQAAGADIVGAEDLAEQVEAGKVDFDRCIATPDMMPLVGKLGKVLGPKGLMPNPKLGTVTPKVEVAVKAAKSGQIEYRVEKTGIMHAGVGKASFSEKQIEENIRALVDVVTKARPTTVKGTFVKRVSICSSMGPSLRVSVADLSGKS